MSNGGPFSGWQYWEYTSIIRPQNTMQFIGGATIAFFSLPIVFLGLQFLWLALRTHIGHPFYVPYDYFWQGVVWLVWGLLILCLGLIPFLRRKGSAPAVVLGVMLLFVAVVAIPSTRTPGDVAQMAREEVRSALRRTNITLAAGAEKSGRFPANQGELDELAQKSGAQERELISRYTRDGRRLPYRLVYVGGAPGPHLPVPAGGEPGIIYCAVSPDLKKVWLTGTTLDEAVAGEVILLPSFEGTGPGIEESELARPAELPEK